MNEFYQKHPLLRILTIDLFLTVAALGVAFFLKNKYQWTSSNILFAESLCFLFIAFCAVNGNGQLRNIDTFAHENGHRTYMDSYAFAITAGLPGIVLFMLSGFYPAM